MLRKMNEGGTAMSFHFGQVPQTQIQTVMFHKSFYPLDSKLNECNKLSIRKIKVKIACKKHLYESDVHGRLEGLNLLFLDFPESSN